MKVLIILVVLFNLSLGTGIHSKKYDNFLEREYNKFFYNYKHIFSYKVIKAQMWQESRFNPIAVSPVGAFGLMQIMPGTFKDLQRRTGTKGLISDPNYNIFLGMFYNYQLFNQWKAERTLKSRYSLMFASYNAGLGHLLNSQKKCGRCAEYEDISKHLPSITGIHSKETLDYVNYIYKFYGVLQ